MSDLLYSHRLWWSGTSGVAICRNLRMPLSAPPPRFEDANYIDYAPEVQVAQMRRAHGPMRDMSAEEIAIAESFLRATLPPEAPDATTHAAA